MKVCHLSGVNVIRKYFPSTCSMNFYCCTLLVSSFECKLSNLSSCLLRTYRFHLLFEAVSMVMFGDLFLHMCQW